MNSYIDAFAEIVNDALVTELTHRFWRNFLIAVAGSDPSPENLALGLTAFRVASMRHGHVGF